MAELYVLVLWFEPMWLEYQIRSPGGLASGRGRQTDGGALPTNVSGGVLSSTRSASGMIRFAEARQCGLAGAHQVEGCRRCGSCPWWWVTR